MTAADGPRGPDTGKSLIGLYIHVPFCTSKCRYCDFYSLPATDELMDRYVTVVCNALADFSRHGRKADTLYLGGGTPSLLGERRLLGILEAAVREFGLCMQDEITLEANPGGDLAALLPPLRRGGFNRISLGLQSLADDELALLGRTHTADQGRQAVQTAHRAGFDNISADVMLGIPLQDRERLQRTLQELCSLPLTHISAYLLKVEKGTPLHGSGARALCAGEDQIAQMYLDCVSTLSAHGFAQYEISNFARHGLYSLHNLKYWMCEDYLGLGPSSHSYLNGQRFFFPRSLDQFLHADGISGLITPDGTGGDFEEYAMLRLRLTVGLNLDEASRRFGANPSLISDRARLLQKHGLVLLDQATVSLTPQGFLLSTSVTAKLLYG